MIARALCYPAKSGERMPTVVNDVLYGDAKGNLHLHQHAGTQFIDLSVQRTATIGDVDALHDYSVGGDDILTGKLLGVFTAVGDAVTINDYARGGNDVMEGDAIHLSMYGDAKTISDYGRGGNDVLSSNWRGGEIIGDA